LNEAGLHDLGLDDLVPFKDLVAAVSSTSNLARGSTIANSATGKGEAVMATYVLVHGGGHGGWCYQRVAQILRKAGHDVYTPTLSGLGERSHLRTASIDLDTQITDVVNVLHYEDLRDVILAGHSYGGLVITGAADRAGDRIGKLVFLDSVAPPNGMSLADIAGDLMNEAKESARVIDGVELVLFPDSPSVRHYGVTDPADVAWMAERLTPHPWKCFTQPIHIANEDALAKIPRYEVICTERVGLAADSDVINAFIEQQRDRPNVWLIDTTHDLMITEPEKTAQVLMKIAEA
jgi:pimeloyl-ACP methyl ester carboxylesterase